MKILFSTLLTLSALCASPAFAADAPATIERASYGAWLDESGSAKSPYFEPLFNWLEEQAGSALPPEVAADPQKLVVKVDRPIAETAEAEANGDVEAGTTYGLETYGVIDAPVATVLETILFRWGKPVGAEEGTTYPVDSVYSKREEKLEKQGSVPGTYRTVTILQGGGVAKDQNDVSSLLVREDGRGGYLLVGQFFGPNGRTASTSSMSFMILRPSADGGTEYLVSGRYTGQSYSFFGIEFGRRNYGFNSDRIRAGQLDFYGQVKELKETGKITERRPRG